MANKRLITVEVAYALPEKQKIISIEIEDGVTALQAVTLSGICLHFPEINITSVILGNFGQKLADPVNYQVKAGDRIEIYRALIADPKETRRLRADKIRKKKEAAAKNQQSSENIKKL